MKKITQILFMMTAFSSFGQAIINFENPNYYSHNGWEGTATVEANPNTSGVNTSATVAKYVTPAGKAWANASVIVLNDVLSWSDLTSLQLDVYGPSTASTYVKLEKEGVGNVAEGWMSPSSANAWETLTPSLTYNGTGDESTATFDKIVVFFNAGDSVGGESWFFDNITLNGLSLDAAAPTGLIVSKPAADEFKVTWDADSNETGGINISIIQGATNIYITTIATGSTEYIFKGTYTNGTNSITVAEGGIYTFVLQSLPDVNSNAYSTISTSTLSIEGFEETAIAVNYNKQTQELTLSGDGFVLDGIKITVHDITGKQVASSFTNKVSLAEVNSGVYIFYAENSAGQKVTRKFVK
ncbi:T9SS type A sorting domain-containing protein [Ochrovirga pacifica]|uniref:T9SS type A sorting domain-containing protein n=1 Tax=Ochrovirga pacifica TaxID=1042376 RepID=UPI0011129A62|nr:T9SS type A sorting domain-containing protein [Ochrovirga pacifica]